MKKVVIRGSHYITLKDNLENLRRQLFGLRKNIIDHNVSIGDLGELLPVGICLNDHRGNQFMNAIGEDTFRRSREELKEMQERYYDTCFYLEETVSFNKQIAKELDNLHSGHVISTFMHVRRPNEANDQLVYETFATIPYKDSYAGLIIGIAPEQLGISNKKISRVLEEDALVIKYFEVFQTLTRREKEIITLVVLGHANPQIADRLFISRATVETHRKNINRKLDIHSFYQLIRFAQAFDLV